MRKLLKVGLIGLGKMGRNHLRILSMLKSVDLRFIYDIDTKIMEELAKQYELKASHNLDEDLKNIDAVVIATPTFTHADFIKKASNYVKKFFVEKPLTDTLESTKEILDIITQEHLLLQVGFIERFNPAVIELKKVLDNSNGYFNIDFYRAHKQNRITDVDVIVDLMIHDIDLALYINGDVEEIEAYGKIKNGLIAFARATLYHKNGNFSSITASSITDKLIRQITVTGEDMYIDCDLLKKEIFIHKQSIKNPYDYVNISSIEETVVVPPRESLLLELQSFIEYCLDDKFDNSFIPKAIDGYKAMKIATNIQKIIQTKIKNQGN